ncbi:MAG: aminotransferase class I/II-fold pyridoxal phosphate-dependent enzyme [Candidatus Buchananbacteria bacterium]|nr:aminotransferase class I/II-fold pyridoxal phosphate-dependent enzyme [Candidatus Buchananbacteria bacterium]
MQIADRLKNLKPSATMELDAQAKAMVAAGEAVINLTAGEPDFSPPESILLATCQAALTGKTKYTQAKGQASLLQKVADFFNLQLDYGSSAKNVMVTSGGKVACFWPLFATINPGDEVIILTPYWTSYPAMVELCGGVPVFFDYKKLSAKDSNQYLLEKLITDKTKAIILNSPNNPAGYVFSPQDLAILEEIFTDKNIWLISDEIYANLVYGSNRHVSIASLNDQLKEKTVIINGASKAFAMTGYRIGFIWGNQWIIGKMAQIQSQVIGCPCSISQVAAEAALKKAKLEVEEMRKSYEHRLNTIIRPFFKQSGKKYFQPEGAFYVFFKLAEGTDCTIFCQDLLKKEKLALVPGQAFGYPGWVRLSYAASEQQLSEGLQRLKNFWIK